MTGVLVVVLISGALGHRVTLRWAIIPAAWCSGMWQVHPVAGPAGGARAIRKIPVDGHVDGVPPRSDQRAFPGCGWWVPFSSPAWSQ